MSKEVIMEVPSFSADYPKAPIYVADLVRCKDCYYAEDDITHMFCAYFHHKVYEYGYCSNAVERSEEYEA